MEEESALLGGNGVGGSKEDKRMRAGITIDFIRRWAWNEGDLDNLEYHIAERRKILGSLEE